MAEGIGEMGKKTEMLLEQGEVTERKLQACRSSLSSAKAQVDAAQAELAAAKETDENGSPKGDVARAQAQLNVARRQMMISQQALLVAQGEAKKVEQDKRTHVKTIERYMRDGRGELKKAEQLKTKAFARSAAPLLRNMAENVNRAIDQKRELLVSLGENAAAEYVPVQEGEFYNAGWRSVSPALLEGIRQRRNADKSLFLSDEQKWRNGLNYIDNMLGVCRQELARFGIAQGPALEQVLALERVRMQQELAKELEGRDSSLYRTPDYEALAAKVRSISEEYPEEYALSAAQRAQIREKIWDGSFTEKEVRQVGARLWERYESVINNRAESGSRILEIRSRQRELALAAKHAGTQGEREELMRRSRRLVWQENVYYTQHSSPQVMGDVLKGIRRIGPADENSKQIYGSGDVGNMSRSAVDAIENVRNYLPTDWVEQGNKRPLQVSRTLWRGQFYRDGDKDVIDLSGTERNMRICAFHEMGHRMEQLYPEILELERQFYERRTQGEALSWLGLGYSPSEKTRRDHFAHPYMGKDYGGAGYELLSMGMEALFTGSRDIYKDREYCEFLLGILALV